MSSRYGYNFKLSQNKLIWTPRWNAGTSHRCYYAEYANCEDNQVDARVTYGLNFFLLLLLCAESGKIFPE